MSRDSTDYSHGDTGKKPTTSLNFEKNERPDAQRFDWFWYKVIESINGHANEFDRLDANDDGIVDEADYANDADASTYKGNDIDSNGDGKVDAAEFADDADVAAYANDADASTYNGNDIDSNGDGRVDAADHASDATTVKTNDIDSDGDGRVDAADHATNADHATTAGDADTLDGKQRSYYAVSGHTHPRSDLDSERYQKQEGGTVDEGSIVPLFTYGLADGETVYVDQAMLTKDGFTTPCVSGVDLVLVPDGSANTTILSGDGTTLYDDESGNPLVSYTNTTGSHQTIMIGIDNGAYNNGYGNAVSAFGGYTVRVV
jgi:hypothetical protein